MTTLTQRQSQQSESLHARIPQEILEDIDRLAVNMGRSRNWVFNEALRQYLETQLWQIDLIKSRLREEKSSRAKFIPHAKIIKEAEKRLKKKLK